MPRNVYWEIFYHLIWRTKDSAALLTGATESAAHKYLIHRALKTPETHVHAVGGTDDHIHLAVSLPPTIEPAKWIGDVKDSCSHEIPRLSWQTGYGIVSFGKRDLPWVIDYIKRQREHHAAGRTEERLERITRLEAEVLEGAPSQQAR